MKPCLVTFFLVGAFCVTYGDYHHWGSWSGCSATCSGGHRRREVIAEDGSRIQQTRACSHMPPCPVDGGFGHWSHWSHCDVTCGHGHQTRHRQCDNPEPAHGGRDCHGDSWQTESCWNSHCPVNGGFGQWGYWSPCDVTCGGGHQTRHRACNNPEPAYGGHSCYGDFADTQDCSKINCPVDGGFGQWSDWTPCDVTCGGGQQTRQRSCDSPAPAYGGRDCSGSFTEQQACNPATCTVLVQCDKLCTVGLIAEQKSAESFTGTSCVDGRQTSADALIGKCCQTQQQWTPGSKVFGSCKQLPLYSAIGQFNNGNFETNSAGVLVGCLDDGSGFMMAKQACGMAPTIIHVTTANSSSSLNSFFSLMSLP